MKNLDRRQFLRHTIAAASSLLLPLPAWARVSHGLGDQPAQSHFDLTLGETPISIDGERAIATGINGTVPGPLLRFREGERVSMRVHNHLRDSSSIHWHGLLLPSNMDGVPGVSFPGIDSESYFDYEFDVVQNGTYWYHSHSGLQEQTGIYGPIIIDPEGDDPVEYDREFVILLSDWTFEDPWKLFANLKKMDAYYNYRRRTLGDFVKQAGEQGFSNAVSDRAMWGGMRMADTDIADVTAATYSFLMNGLGPGDNWTGVFKPGERVRLRFINGSAMTLFNVRIPGLPMDVVQADGINTESVTVDEFQIGVAETYDVVVTPTGDEAFTVFAESIDRSGYARGTLTPDPEMLAEVPELRDPPLLTMTDMAMDHGNMGGMDHGDMDHSMHHGNHGGGEEVTHDHKRGPGVANVAENPRSRLAEPGTGLEDVDHRVLTYADLKGLNPVPDFRPVERTLELHLTGNMERYMWSFDGIKFTEVDGPILFRHGERLRMVLVNDTMMNHPIHLHGMFVELDNGNGEFNPQKHTIIVKPGERLAANISADAIGDWAFHCHLLYHMKAGMMRIVSVVEEDA